MRWPREETTGAREGSGDGQKMRYCRYSADLVPGHQRGGEAGEAGNEAKAVTSHSLSAMAGITVTQRPHEVNDDGISPLIPYLGSRV